MNEAYAAQIARDWNTKSGLCAGYVTRFPVNDAYATSLPTRTVGAREHQELWVPAEKLEEFNDRLEGRINVVEAFFDDNFKGMITQHFSLKGKDATAQLVGLNGIHGYSLMDFHGEIAANKEAVFAHFPFWKRRDFIGEGVTDAHRATLLNAIRKVWSDVSPEIPLSDV